MINWSTCQAVERDPATLGGAVLEHAANSLPEAEKWISKNRAALEAYNRHVEKCGVISDGLRSF